ncbi:hypothetical protein GCM10022216_28050 [Sphingobacterium kyonggiense]|uniref:YtkA-like protein n=1 Tax=Sphingobacterium kyonggiense TaxID=714075 RepID=A0ABP7Z3J4_9SPHI
MKKLVYVICLSITALFMGSCDKEEALELPLQGKVKVGETTLATGELLSIYSDNELSVGYHPLYFQLTKDGKTVRNDKLSFTTLMDMGTMKHASPYGTLAYSNQYDAYATYAIFTMPSGESGSWTLEVKADDKTIAVPVIIKPATAGNVPVKTITAKDGSRYVLALVEPSKPKIGLNDLHVMIFKRSSMFDFPAMEGLTLAFHPEMTSMNHGSSNNQNPVDAGKGLYKGKVNYSMTGDWRLFFTIHKGGELLAEEVYLDVLF